MSVSYRDVEECEEESRRQGERETSEASERGWGVESRRKCQIKGRRRREEERRDCSKKARGRLHKTVWLDGRQEDEGLHAFFEALTNQPFLSFLMIKKFLVPQWTSSCNPKEQKTKFRWLFERRMDGGGRGADG